MLDALTSIVDFLTTGIYDFIIALMAWLTIKITVWWFSIKIASISFFWEVVAEMLAQLNMSDFINELWGQLDSSLLATLTYFRLPEALNMVLNARVTRFVMSLWGMK